MEAMKEEKKKPSFHSQACKKMIPQLLISISLFSFAYSYTLLYKLSPFPISYYLPLSSFPLPTNSLNKNCLFLICNGLLVFLTKTSVFIVPSDGDEDTDCLFLMQSCLEAAKLDPLLAEEVGVRVEEVRKQGSEEVSIFIGEGDEDGGSGGFCILEYDEQGEIQEAEEQEGMDLSVEELNQRAEDFIRRMKRGL